MRKITDYKQYILDRITVNEYTNCWEWKLQRGHHGYGYALGRRSHQISYEAWKGPIPDGLEIDHLCCNTSCCNPWHLEAVTHFVNVMRSDLSKPRLLHCKRGHEFTEDNTKILQRKNRQNGNYMRLCKLCNNARNKISRDKKRNMEQIEK